MSDVEARIRLSGDGNSLIATTKLSVAEMDKLRKSADSVNKSSGGLLTNVKSLTSNLLNMRSVMIGITTGVAAHFYQQQIETLDSVAKTADAIGISTSEWQRYSFAAERSGVDTGTMTTALEGVVARIGQAKAGTGALVTYLQRYDKTLLKNIQTSKSTDEAVRLIFEAMGNATNAMDKAGLAGAAFGLTVGPKMAVLVKGGVGTLNELKATADRLGIVLNEQLLRNAEKANDQLTDMKRIVGVELAAAMVNISPLIISASQNIGTLTQGVHNFLDQFKDPSERNGIYNLSLQLTDLIKRKHLIEQDLAQHPLLAHLLEPNVEGVLKDTNNEIDAIYKRIGELQRAAAGSSKTPNGEVSPDVLKIQAAQKAVDSLSKSLRLQADTYGLGADAALRYRITQGDINDQLKLIGPAGAKARATLLGYANALQTERRAQEQTAAAMKRHNDLFNEGARLMQRFRTPQEIFSQQLMHLNELWQEGAIDTQTYYRAIAKSQDDFVKNSNKDAIQWADIWSSEGNRFAAGIGDAVGQAVIYSQNLAQGIHSVAQTAGAQIISTLTAIGIKKAALALFDKENIATTTGVSVAAGGTIAAAWAPAAAAVSLASYGANAVPASAGITSTYALTEGLALAGIAHDGLDYVPTDGTYLLAGGERIVRKDDNRALTAALKDGSLGSKRIILNQQVNLSAIDATGLAGLVRRIGPTLSKMALSAVQKAFNAHGKEGPFG